MGRDTPPSLALGVPGAGGIGVGRWVKLFPNRCSCSTLVAAGVLVLFGLRA